jgi:O-acetyl-ADP-ribose deacetylase
MPLYEFEGKRPSIGEGTWIAPSADIIGDVTIGRHCYIGFGAIIRGDFGPIRIGDESAIEEAVVIHEAESVTIGRRVIIGHTAMLHDVIIHDHALIGMQSMICHQAEIMPWAIVAEQSLVMKHQKIPGFKIFGGAPAREIGDVTARHQEMLVFGQDVYAGLAARYHTGFKRIDPTSDRPRHWSDRIEIVKGDITHQDTDAIVNAANESLLGGGGVDGAIHRAAGPELLEECCQIGGCPTGAARITRGYRLKARYVIHTVGPIWQGGDRREAELLTACYRSVLELAVQNDIRTLAFPSISTGVYGFPLDKACRCALKEVARCLEHQPSIQRVRFVCFSSMDLQTYRQALAKMVEPTA